MKDRSGTEATRTSPVERVKWTIDPVHSDVQFKVKHLMISTVTGDFREYHADIEVAGDDLSTAKVVFTADINSITTHNDQRDAHLRSTDFFSGEKHPKLTFTATGAESVDHDGSWTLWGDLSMNGITKGVTLDVEWGGVIKDPYGNTKAGVSIHGKINRRDWNINWNAALEAGGMMLSDDVRIACEVQLVKQG